MRGRIPENVLDDILSRVDIVELISAYIPLKKAGRNFRACCPFHNEKTPSFMVSPDKQIYHCFGCGESGNAFKFLMRHERMEFTEAVELLARRCGVVIPQLSADRNAEGVNAQIFKANQLAAGFFSARLFSTAGSAALTYLQERGLRREILESVGVGLAPDSWDGLISFMRGKGIPLSLLDKAGLITPRQGGGYYDRFRNRIMFPISDARSRIIGFGGRVYSAADKGVKYINSPETAVYTKGRNLYGLNLSKDAVRKKDCAVVVEGYLDFLIPYQEGVDNLVASQGTALTEEQIRLLKRYASGVVIIYDGDKAGESAALRALELFIEEGMNVRVAVLPQGDDPDTFVRREGPEAFRGLIDGAKEIFDYKLGVLKSRHNVSGAAGKDAVAAEMLSIISKFHSAVVRSEYLRVLAGELNVPEEALLEELNKIKSGRKEGRRTERDKQVPSRETEAVLPAEKLLIQLMLQENELISRIRDSLDPADFQSRTAGQIVRTMFELSAQGVCVGAGMIMNHLEGSGISGIVCDPVLSSEDVSAEEKEKMASDCVKRIKMHNMNNRRRCLHQQIKDAQVSGDRVKLDGLLKEFNTLIKPHSFPAFKPGMNAE
ncbi:MAG: DNA primase [Candidatus Omnitrophota bacterium]|nr:DNA primase [Candidatus Omnitrophota bacterium]MDD5526632.1 DNA primase [Candidatus Omnitrophota bacterium]